MTKYELRKREIMTKEQVGACKRRERASKTNIQSHRPWRDPMGCSCDLAQDIQQVGGSRKQSLHLCVKCHISAPELLQFTSKCIWLDLIILRVFSNLNNYMIALSLSQRKLALRCSAVKCSRYTPLLLNGGSRQGSGVIARQSCKICP